MIRKVNWAATAVGVTLLSALPAAADMSEALAGADIAKGEKVFKKCKSCHTAEQGGKKRTGPNLFGIVGGPVAAVDGFKYSDAFVEYAGEWTPERLDAFLTKPKAEIKKTKMSFAGLKKEADRVNLIAYLNSHSETPIAFGGAAESAEVASSEEEEPEFGILKVAPGVETTYYSCTACHSEMIVAQQGLSREHWEDLFEWMVEDQGMNEFEEPDRSIILDYLTEHYNEDRPNFPKR